MGSYLGGLVIRRIVNVASEIWGAYFQEGLLFISSFFWGGGALLSEFYRNFRANQTYPISNENGKTFNPFSSQL